VAIVRYLAEPEEDERGLKSPLRAEARSTSKGAWVFAAAITVVAIALGFVAYRHAAEEPPRLVKLSLLPPEKSTITTTSPLTVSPDGRRLAFAAATAGKTELWVRDLDALTARPLPGTEGAHGPFWSPDSRTVAFFADGKLKRIDVAGGPAVTLCDANGLNGSWGPNGVIVFADRAIFESRSGRQLV
jgi:Tol biopolymer transport system component